MKRLTTFLLAFLFVFACFGQRVQTYDSKVLTYGGEILANGLPPDMIAGLEFWYDGRDAATLSLNGNKVIQWDDKSGNARHVSNAVDAQRPTYSAITGRLTFVAANSTYLQSAAFGPLTQPNTIYILYKIIGALGDNEKVFDAVTDLNQLFYYIGNDFVIYAGVGLTDGANNANDNIHTAEFNGVTSNYWVNGVLVAGPANVGATNLDGITLGARGNFTHPADVEIMEVFGYNSQLTSDERIQLTNYLQDKWDLSLWLIILLIPNIRRKLKIAA